MSEIKVKLAFQELYSPYPRKKIYETSFPTIDALQHFIKFHEYRNKVRIFALIKTEREPSVGDLFNDTNK